MAGSRKDVEVVISAVDRFTGTLGKVTAALASMYGVYKLGAEAVSQAQEQEAAETRLAVALGRTSKALLDHASAMQQSTKFSDDAVITAQATVAAFIKDEEQIHRVTAAAADMATAMGMDLNSAAQLLTKSIAGQMNSLGRYGIEIEGAAGSNARLESAVNAVNRAFGGQAEATGGTFSGSVTRLKNAWSELLEVFGNVIVRNPAVIAAMTGLMDVLTKASGSSTTLRENLQSLVNGGLMLVMRFVGGAINILSFFDMGWRKAKLTIAEFVDFLWESFDGLYDMLRESVLSPVEKIFEALEKAGIIEVNPFDSIKIGILEIRAEHARATAQFAGETSLMAGYYKGLLDSIANTQEQIAAAGSIQTKPKIPGSGADDSQQENEAISQTLLARLQLKKDIAAEEGAWTDEARAADLEWFEADQAYKIEQLELKGATEAQILEAQESAKMALQLRTMQFQQRLRQMQLQGTQQSLAMTSQAFQMMAQQGGAHARRWFSMYKAAATAEAIVSTIAGAARALKDYPPPVSYAMMAATLLLGFAQVSKIRSQSFEGGAGAGAGASMSANVPTTPMVGGPEAGQVGGNVPLLGGNQGQGQAVTNVYMTVNNPLSGDNWDALAEQHLVPVLNRSADRGIQLQANAVAAG